MSKYKVLVVDNAKNQRELYRLILEDAGYDVTTAQDGEQALQLARNNYFDLILTDDKTSGTGGLALAINLIKQNPSVFVLMVITGSIKTLTHGTAEMIREGLRGAPFGFLEKPVDRGVLLSILENAIERNQRSSEFL